MERAPIVDCGTFHSASWTCQSQRSTHRTEEVTDKRPTIIDVAEAAGVSKSTVSLVLRGSERVSEGTAELVLAHAARLGYRYHAAAATLSAGKSRLVGVLISDMHNPFYAELTEGIDALLTDLGYRMLIKIGKSQPERELEAIDSFLDLRVDGLVLAGPVAPIRLLTAAVESSPTVIAARSTFSRSLDSVVNDDETGAELVVEHLVQLGHRRIAHIDGGVGGGSDQRRKGYKDAMSTRGLAGSIFIADGDYTEAGGASGMRQILELLPRPPSAVFAANDLSAVGAIQVLDEHGLKVPGDVSVAGYDNTALAGLRRIGLTTVDQPRYEIGMESVRLLFQRINEGRSRSRRLVLTPKLVQRRTTGPSSDIE